MTDQVLDILKLVLLALLYLFFARVLWAVWSEVRRPVDVRRTGVVVPSSSRVVPAWKTVTPSRASASATPVMARPFGYLPG